MAASNDPDQDFRVDSELDEAPIEREGRAARLREAVKAAGGQRAVADRSGVKFGTLGHYLGGREMKAGAFIALAAATGVRLEWLATGEGPMRPGAPPPGRLPPQPPQTPPAPPDPPPPPPEKPRRAKAFATIDIPALAECVEAVQEQFARMGVKRSPVTVMQAAILLYDELMVIRDAAAADSENSR